MSQRSGRGLSRVATLGIKELPGNTAWLLSKAFGPVAHGTATLTSNVGESVSGLAASAASATESATVGARRTAEWATEAVSGATRCQIS